MEYIVFWGAFLLFVIAVVVKGIWDARRNEKMFRARLEQDYGKLPAREYKAERFSRLDRYYRNHQKDGQIDDITWNDLNMDEIFKQMNHTLSSAGEEYLYYTLRTPEMSEDVLRHREEQIRYFAQNPKQRVSVQLLMRKLGTAGDYSLYDYLEYLGNLGKRSNGKHIAALLLIAAFLVLCFFEKTFPLGIFGALTLLVYNIVTYFKEKSTIGPYVTSFAYVMRLLEVSENLTRLSLPVCAAEFGRIKKYCSRLAAMKRGSFWVMSGGSAGTGGNPLEILMDYMRMALHVDIIVFNKMVSELNRHIEDVDGLVTETGSIETAICIACYRASIEKELKNNWCIPQFLQGNIVVSMKEGYHPLIHEPVKNSIVSARGVLLTGSNASGKSTFLKTVALNAILAQTIHTCTADGYEAPFFRIMSSMTLRDDIEGGESYYIVEIRSLKRILDASGGEIPVLCFIDEVLRGTNTVERIAASAQILKSLTGKNIICFAATHDIELTHLLEKYYNNYHFEEEIKDGDISFNYRLLNGKATTRNAIKLLELMGYEEEIIKKASRQAEVFLETGDWVLT